MKRESVLIVHQQLQGLERIGGAEAVCVWAIEALKDQYYVHLAVPHIGIMASSADELNKQYGTNLKEGDFKLVEPKMWKLIRPLVSWSWILHTFIYMRFIRKMSRQFDLLFSTYNEFDFGQRKAVQYLHFPMIEVATQSKVKNLIARFIGYNRYNVINNISLTCSDWTRRFITDTYQVLNDIKVLYPPITAVNEVRSMKDRTQVVLFVGRISPEKRIEECIEIIDKVRFSGFDIKLTIVGPRANKKYAEYIDDLVTNCPWVDIKSAMKHEELLSLYNTNCFGINGTKDEQFGITIAEMVANGVIVFVPNGGGQIEVVGEQQQIFNKIDDAVAKICTVLSDEKLQADLHQGAIKRGKRFSSEQYKVRLRELFSQV